MASVPELDDRYCRYFVAAGTASYEFFDDADQLGSVTHDLQLMVRLFTERLGYQHLLPELGRDPTSGQFRISLSDWLTSGSRTAREVVVIYYSGHGAIGPDRRHYLLTRDSRPNNLVGTAIATEEILRMFAGTAVQHALVLLDTCYAGTGAEDLVSVLASVTASRGTDEAAGSGLWFVAATRPKEEAAQHTFAPAFARAINDPRHGRVHQRYLDPNALVGAINEDIRKTSPHQHARGSMGDSSGGSPLLPNPRYRPDIPAGFDLDTQHRLLRAADFVGHWGPRSRGVEVEAQQGWYFTGRTSVLREVVAWLSDPVADGRMRVITGGPGSGKSAVLARLVTLSDAVFRQSVPSDQLAEDGTAPPAGSIDVAVVARDKTLAEVIEAIAQATGLPPAEPAMFVDSILRRKESLTIVLDALDEAKMPKAVARRVLAPLAAARRSDIKVLVGCRREVLTALGAAKSVIDLDDPGYLALADLSAYVYKSLMAKGQPLSTPFRNRPRLAQQVAGAVAARAYPTFLIARVVSRYLAEASQPVDISRRDWRQRFPATVGDALDQYLERFGENEQRVRDLLQPLAYAGGAGLPWENLWAPIASALSGISYTDSDVRWLLQQAGAYIIEAVEEGRSVYRLYHNALAEHLRSTGQEADAHSRIANVLVERTPVRERLDKPDWIRAHPYVRAHLAWHAAAAGAIDAFLDDPLFLVAATASRLVEVLPSAREEQALCAARTFQRIAHRLVPGSFAENAALLELTARCNGHHSLADALVQLALDQPWRVPWAIWTSTSEYRLVGRQDGAVKALATGEFDGQSFVVSAGSDGTVRRWDLTEGIAVGDPLTGHDGPVNAVAIGRADGQALVVSAGSDGTVRRWDLAEGIAVGDPLTGHDGPVNAVAIGQADGQALVVSAGADGTVRRWDLAEGIAVGDPLTGHDGPVNAVAIGQADGKALVVSAGADGTVRRWDLAEGIAVGDPLTGHQGPVNTVSIVEIDGKSIVVSGGNDWAMRRWTLRDGVSVGGPVVEHSAEILEIALGFMNGKAMVASASTDTTVRLRCLMADAGNYADSTMSHDGVVTSVAFGVVEQRLVLVTGSADSTIRRWNPAETQAARPSATSQNGAVAAVAIGKSGGRLVVMSGGGDRTMRRWDVVSGKEVGSPVAGHQDWVNAMAAAETEGGCVIVSAGGDGTVRRWDLESGSAIGDPLSFDGDWVNTVAVATSGVEQVIVAGGAGGILRRWNLTLGTPIGDALTGHFGGVSAVAVAPVGGLLIIVSAGADKTLRRWDFASGRPIGAPLAGHDAKIWSIATGNLGGQTVAVSGDDNGKVLCWDLTSGQSIGTPIQAHTAEVFGVAVGRLGNRERIVTGGGDGLVRLWHPSGLLEHTIPMGGGILDLALVESCCLVLAGWRGLVRVDVT